MAFSHSLSFSLFRSSPFLLYTTSIFARRLDRMDGWMSAFTVLAYPSKGKDSLRYHDFSFLAGALSFRSHHWLLQPFPRCLAYPLYIYQIYLGRMARSSFFFF